MDARTSSVIWSAVRLARSPSGDHPLVLRFPSYLFGWNTLYAAVAIGAYPFTAPSAADAESLLDSWVLQLLGRNLLVAVAWYGLFHLRLYIQRALIAPLRPKLQWQWASQFCRHAF
jgi:hypothetical protein